MRSLTPLRGSRRSAARECRTGRTRPRRSSCRRKQAFERGVGVGIDLLHGALIEARAALLRNAGAKAACVADPRGHTRPHRPPAPLPESAPGAEPVLCRRRRKIGTLAATVTMCGAKANLAARPLVLVGDVRGPKSRGGEIRLGPRQREIDHAQLVCCSDGRSGGDEVTARVDHRDRMALHLRRGVRGAAVDDRLGEPGIEPRRDLRLRRASRAKRRRR